MFWKNIFTAVRLTCFENSSANIMVVPEVECTIKPTISIVAWRLEYLLSTLKWCLVIFIVRHRTEQWIEGTHSSEYRHGKVAENGQAKQYTIHNDYSQYTDKINYHHGRQIGNGWWPQPNFPLITRLQRSDAPTLLSTIAKSSTQRLMTMERENYSCIRS